MEHRLGITGTALKWFQSYLSDGSQAVTIRGTLSSPAPLSCGVPQGSVLGPILFTIYTLPLGDIIRKHDTKFHLYADDAQLYLAFNRSGSPTACNDTLRRLEACIADIRRWMPLNGLKLNDGKTEFMLLQSKHVAPFESPNISIGDDTIAPASSARNLGVVFDSTLSMSAHLKAVC